MLDISRSYFGEAGVTITSANHLCNVAKERYEYLESELNNLSFVSESISIIGSNETIQSRIATKKSSEIPAILNEIAHLKGFIAIMRTAIKEKENLETKLQSYKSDEYIKYTLQFSKIPMEPVMPRKVSVEDLQKHLSASAFNRYLILEAKAATIGQAIHPSGEYARARKEAFNRLSASISVSENGRDTIIRKYNLDETKEDIDATFFELQTVHRELEAEMNGLKSQVETILKDEYQTKLHAYNLAVKEVDTKEHELLEASNKERNELINKLRSLKIIIPPQYVDLVRTLS